MLHLTPEEFFSLDDLQKKEGRESTSTDEDAGDIDGNSKEVIVTLKYMPGMTFEEFFSQDPNIVIDPLRYKTRGISCPQGKPRVLYAGHPEDFSLYFQDLSDQILRKSNCTILYFDPTTKTISRAQWDASVPRLSQIQLIVMPITTKLLTEDCTAMSLVLPFANDHHIPVLPIMEEPGLTEVFSKHFGSLQYLDPHADDPTEIPYEAKLTSYLNDVLVGDETATRVRAAFDAYIFMSYRKKDRAYAQELIRLIHANPLCRDIAIWYDEYLTPGENFNDSIHDALEKSDLFAMVVTPSLLERPNYVMSQEYPTAKKAKKPILPVEMAPTDADELGKNYDGISSLCKPEQTEVSERLLGFLENTATMESNDQVHNFLIGLAYLDGIDVEVDQERAVRLITGAANAGMDEAIRKLVTMYRIGKGVERNYQHSIEWQAKLIDLLRRRYQDDQSLRNIEDLTHELLQFGDACSGIDDYKRAHDCYREAELLVSEMSDTDFEESKTVLPRIYGSLGDTELSLGKPEKALEYYKESLKADLELNGDSTETESLLGPIAEYIRIGQVEKELGLQDQAVEYFKLALILCGDMSKESLAPESLALQSLCNTCLGDVEISSGHLQKAKEYYGKAFSLNERVLEGSPSSTHHSALVTSLVKLGEADTFLGCFTDAKEIYEKALSLGKDLAEKTGTIDSRRTLTICLQGLGDLEKTLGRLEEAKRYYEEALHINKDIAEETESLLSYRNLAASYLCLGQTEKSLGQFDDAKRHYKNAISLNEMLKEQFNVVFSPRDLPISYMTMGDIETSIGHTDVSIDYYMNGLGIFESLAKDTGTIMSRYDLSVAYRKLGDAETALEQYNEAGKYYRKAITVLKGLAKETGMIDSYERLGICLYKLSQISEKPDNVRCLRAAYNIFSNLADDYPQINKFADSKKEVFERLKDLT